MNALVQLLGVSKTFGAAAALHPADLSFERGKTTVLIGPSGCGKSTLLRLIIGLLEPDGGTIQFDGAPITFANIAELRRRIGYVIQDGGLFPHLTARKNVLLMPTHLKRPAAEMDQRLAELCALTRFPQGALDRYPIELSGGQRQRISLMRALALSPELLLLDEPLGALDPLVRAALQKDLKEIFVRLKQTAILVTHDLAEAAYLGDEIVLMNEGRVVQIGTLEDLRTKPASDFVTEFINAQRGLARDMRNQSVALQGGAVSKPPTVSRGRFGNRPSLDCLRRFALFRSLPRRRPDHHRLEKIHGIIRPGGDRETSGRGCGDPSGTPSGNGRDHHSLGSASDRSNRILSGIHRHDRRGNPQSITFHFHDRHASSAREIWSRHDGRAWF